MTDLFASPSDFARTARLVTASDLDSELSRLSDSSAAHARASGFEAGPGQVVMLPGEAGLDALVGAGSGQSPFDAAGAALALPEGDWAYDGLPEGWDATQTAIAFALGGYQFTRYKSPKRAPARLVTAQDCDVAEAERVAKGVMLTRDLINTPAGDMLPSHLEAEARKLADAHGASVTVTTGDDSAGAKLSHDPCRGPRRDGRPAPDRV
jgi:leucyl aminopeptidase